MGRQLRWLAANPERGSDVLEGVVRLLSGSAQRLQRRSWRSMAGCGCEGRYVPDTAMVDTANQEAELRAAAAQGFEAWLRAKISAAADTEINVELGEMTLNRHHMQLTLTLTLTLTLALTLALTPTLTLTLTRHHMQLLERAVA